MLQVLVFNCDGEFDFKSVGRIFMGLVKCGAWGCFDEFNRLEEDVLSAVSQQIQLIHLCRQAGAAHDKTDLLALLPLAVCRCTYCWASAGLHRLCLNTEGFGQSKLYVAVYDNII